MSKPIKVVIDRLGPGKFVWHELRANGMTVCLELKAAQRTLELDSRKAIDAKIVEFNDPTDPKNHAHRACQQCREHPSNTL